METETDCESDSEKKLCNGNYQVIIIGAGISGLSAARHLRKNGIEDIIILEATDKAGGRIHSVDFGEGIVELGAQWIHGEQNEFCQLVKASNHRHEKTSWEGKGEFLCPKGKKIENSMVNEVLGWVEDTIEEIEATLSIETFQDGVVALNGNNSMGKYLQDKFVAYLEKSVEEEDEAGAPEQQDLKMALFQWAMSFQRIDNSCHRMNDVSLYRWSEFEVNPGEHYNNFREGADAFIQDVLVGTKDLIKYNSPVENISWNPENSNALVKVSTKSGVNYTAESVLVTCSIGVLKSSLNSLFTPNLPENIDLAIRSTGFGPVTKIFIEWEVPWWSSDFKGLQLVWPNEFIDSCEGNNVEEDKTNLEETWYKTITGFDPVLDNPTVLIAWLGGPEAVYAETMAKDDVIKRCVQVLTDFTGLSVPEPKNIIVSKWNTNEFFQGAYSFRSVDGDKFPGDICAALCEPINVTDAHGKDKPVIMLAGEALSKSHYSTLHGAYESGILQAQKIIQYFGTCSLKTSKPSKGDVVRDLNEVKSSQNHVLNSQSKDKSTLQSDTFMLTNVNVPVNDIKVPS